MKDVSFFPFPVKAEKRRLWERLVRRENFEVTRHTRICSLHWAGDGPSVEEPHLSIFPYNSKWRDTQGRHSSVQHATKRQQAARKQAWTDVPATVAAPVLGVSDFTPETMDPIPAEKPKVAQMTKVPDVAHYMEVSSKCVFRLSFKILA